MHSLRVCHSTYHIACCSSMVANDIQDMWDLRKASPPPIDWDDDGQEWEYVGIVSEEVDTFFEKRCVEFMS